MENLQTTAKTSLVEAVNELSSEKQQKITESSKLPWTFISGTPSIPSEVTESVVSGWGFTKNTGTYNKPSGGIPKSDLASAVQKSLDKADTALQSGALSGYATQTWVTQQKYLTQHQDISGKADKAVVTTNGASSLSLAITASNYSKPTIITCGQLSSITLTSVENIPNEVVLIFSTGSNVSNFLTIPSGTKVVNEINIEASKSYIMSVLGGAVVVGETTLSA